MILPLWGQGCVVTYRGERVMGVCHSAKVDHNGCYRIDVYSARWGYDLAFRAADIKLLRIKFADGSGYDAKSAFEQKYTKAEIDKMLSAELQSIAMHRERPASAAPDNNGTDGVVLPQARRIVRRPAR